MSSELSSLNTAVTTDRPVGYGTSLNAQTSFPITEIKTAAQPESHENPLLSDLQQKTSAQETEQTKKNQDGLITKATSEAAKKEDIGISSMSASELREILDEINSALYSYNRSLRFEVHEDTKDLVVKVLNTKTDEVIRQYPSEEVLEHRAKLLAGDTNFFSAQIS